MTRERAKELSDNSEPMTAFAAGKQVQRLQTHSCDPHAQVSSWVDDNDPSFIGTFRIKPEPRLRPWKPEEVPVGAVVLDKADPTTQRVIMWSIGNKIAVGGLGEVSSEHLLNHHELAYGKPCGVEDGSP